MDAFRFKQKNMFDHLNLFSLTNMLLSNKAEISLLLFSKDLCGEEFRFVLIKP